MERASARYTRHRRRIARRLFDFTRSVPHQDWPALSTCAAWCTGDPATTAAAVRSAGAQSRLAWLPTGPGEVQLRAPSHCQGDGAAVLVAKEEAAARSVKQRIGRKLVRMVPSQKESLEARGQARERALLASVSAGRRRAGDETVPVATQRTSSQLPVESVRPVSARDLARPVVA